MKYSKVKYLVFFTLFFFLIPQAFSSGSLADRLFKRMIDILVVRHEMSAGPLLEPWASEVEVAWRGVLANEEFVINTDLISEINSRLRTPEIATDFIRRNKARLVDLDPRWQQILPRYIGTEAAREAEAIGARGLVVMAQGVGGVGTEFDSSLLNRYYQDRILQWIGDVHVHPILSQVPQIRQGLSKMTELFSPQGQARLQRCTPLDRATMINSTLDDAARQVDEGIGALIAALPSNARLERAVGKLRQISEYAKSLGMLEIFMDYSYLPRVDFYMAQIWMAAPETKKFALTLLLQHVEQEGTFLTRMQLREILCQPNTEFRRFAFGSLKKQVGVSPEAASALDAEFLNTVKFFPGEEAFEEAVETAITLSQSLKNREGVHGRILQSAGASRAEQCAALRALGRIDTPAAFETLVAQVEFVVMMRDLEMLKLTVGEILKQMNYSQGRFVAGMRVLRSLNELAEPEVRRVAICGIGEALSHENTSFLVSLLLREENPSLQAEILLGIIKSKELIPEIDEAVNFARRKLLGIETDLKFASAMLLLYRGGKSDESAALEALKEVLVAEAKVVRAFREEGGDFLPESVRRVLLSDDTQILLIREVRKRGSNLGELKEALEAFIDFDVPDRVTIEAARALAAIKDRESVDLFFGLFDRATGSQKREVLHMVLENYTDPLTLRRVVRKIVELYNDPRFDFDIFDQFSREITPIERLSLILRGDRETIEFLHTVIRSETASFGTQDFAKALLSVLQ